MQTNDIRSIYNRDLNQCFHSSRKYMISYQKLINQLATLQYLIYYKGKKITCLAQVFSFLNRLTSMLVMKAKSFLTKNSTVKKRMTDK